MPFERLEWSTRALAQSSEVQTGLYPDFVEVADELVLDWEEGLGQIDQALTVEQTVAIERLESFILSNSGSLNPGLWTMEALASAPEWQTIRQRALELIQVMQWSPESPGPSQDLFVGLPSISTSSESSSWTTFRERLRPFWAKIFRNS